MTCQDGLSSSYSAIARRMISCPSGPGETRLQLETSRSQLNPCGQERGELLWGRCVCPGRRGGHGMQKGEMPRWSLNKNAMASSGVLAQTFAAREAEGVVCLSLGFGSCLLQEQKEGLRHCRRFPCCLQREVRRVPEHVRANAPEDDHAQRRMRSCWLVRCADKGLQKSVMDRGRPVRGMRFSLVLRPAPKPPVGGVRGILRKSAVS